MFIVMLFWVVALAFVQEIVISLYGFWNFIKFGWLYKAFPLV